MFGRQLIVAPRVPRHTGAAFFFGPALSPAGAGGPRRWRPPALDHSGLISDSETWLAVQESIGSRARSPWPKVEPSIEPGTLVQSDSHFPSVYMGC